MSDDESPCIGICTIDDNGYCEGCGRNLLEIETWQESDSSQKAEIKSNAAARLTEVPA